MWNRASSFANAKALLAVAGLQSFALLKVANCGQSQEPKKTEKLGVYLTDGSKEYLKSFLKKNGISNSNIHHVCVSDEITTDDAWYYRPLFGSKMAFRAKGIITNENGDIVVVGRVSTFSGEIKHENFIANLPIEKEVSKTNDFWKLSLLANGPGNVNNKALCKPVSVLEQIVLEGKLCSDKYSDGEGNCLYDEKLHGTPPPVVKKKVNKQKTAEPVSTDDDKKKGKCPLCEYMKAGACKDQFVAWNSCLKELGENDDVSVCQEVTYRMMKCMQPKEYYDVMTAGIDMSQWEVPPERSGGGLRAKSD